MGKSGLIAHVFNRDLVQRNFKSFSIDLYPTTSLSEMILLLAKEITGQLKRREEKILDSFLAIVKSLRPGFKIDSVTGQLVFDLSLGEIVHPTDSLKEIFQYLESSEIPCVVAMDEFQQIAEYPDKNVLELLRSHVQKCKHTWFIFAGSDRRMMENALTFVIKSYARTFQEQMNTYPEAQKQLLIAISKEGNAEQVTSVAFCKKHAMKSPSTVQSAMRVLHDKGIVRKEGNSYSITNRLLSIWLKAEY